MTETPARTRLASILSRIFADGVIQPEERQEMITLFREAKITVPEVRETFAAFLKSEMHIVLADGKVTSEERDKLRTIVRELKLPEGMIPEEVKRMI